MAIGFKSPHYKTCTQSAGNTKFPHGSLELSRHIHTRRAGGLKLHGVGKWCGSSRDKVSGPALSKIRQENEKITKDLFLGSGRSRSRLLAYGKQ